MSVFQNPLLSIIVPFVNEVEELSFLINILNEQVGISFELIVCDGGSCDDQVMAIKKMISMARFETRYTSVTRGRGVQMNAGAHLARGELLMFLHSNFNRGRRIQAKSN
jgi:glycosyltransferase involved in cell wall biosynthesis